MDKFSSFTEAKSNKINRENLIEQVEDCLIDLSDLGYKVSNYKFGAFDPVARNFASEKNKVSNAYRYTKKAISFLISKQLDHPYLTLDEVENYYIKPCNVIKQFSSKFKYDVYFLYGNKQINEMNDDGDFLFLPIKRIFEIYVVLVVK